MKLHCCRVMMEPELEAMAGGLGPYQRRALASKFARWARQLRVSSHVLLEDRKPRPRKLPRAKKETLVTN